MAEGKAKPKVDKDDDWVTVPADEWTTVSGGTSDQMTAAQTGPPPDILQSFLGRLGGAVQGLGQLAQTGYKAATQPMAAIPELKQLGQGLIQPHIEMGQKSLEAFRTIPDPFERQAKGYGYAAAALIPGYGPTLGTAAEQIAAGNYQQPIGELSADLLLAFIPAALKKLKFNPTTLLNPVEQKAVEYAVQKGMPVNLATGTGNPMYSGAQAVVEKMPFSGARGQKFKLASNEALQAESRDLAGRSAAVPAQDLYEAGGKLYKSVENKLKNEVIPQQKAAYDALDEIASRPQNIKTVQTGTEMSKVVRPGGKPIMTPVFEQIAGPVDIRFVKAKLKPLYEDLIKGIPIAQRDMSPGLTALKNVIDSPDIVPLSKATKDYSAILRRSRSDLPDVKNASQGIASAVGDPYRKAIDSAVSKMDPSALKLLNEGRVATVEKYRLSDLVEDLGDEPGKIADMLIQGGDKSFSALQEIAKEFPDQIQVLGRSYLERIFNQATNEGGFKGARALTDWHKIGPRTKNLLYADKALQEDLGNFFQYAKMTGIDPNPSQSGKVASLIAAGGMVIHHPVTGAMYVMSGNALSRVLYGAGGAKLVARSLKLPMKSAAGMDAARRLWIAYSFSTQDQQQEDQAYQ